MCLPPGAVTRGCSLHADHGGDLEHKAQPSRGEAWAFSTSRRAHQGAIAAAFNKFATDLKAVSNENDPAVLRVPSSSVRARWVGDASLQGLQEESAQSVVRSARRPPQPPARLLLLNAAAPRRRSKK